jgi:hypothetical protein
VIFLRFFLFLFFFQGEDIVTIILASSGDTFGWALITARPQDPLPPLITLCASISMYTCWTGYLLAMSLKAGPTDLLSFL